MLLTDVLELDAVARVRDGTGGVSRTWEQITRSEVELPIYGGAVRPPPG